MLKAGKRPGNSGDRYDMLDRQTMGGQMNGWMEKEVNGQREKLLPGGRGERRRSGMVAPNLREAVRSQGSGHSKESMSVRGAPMWIHAAPSSLPGCGGMRLLQEPFSFLSPAALALPGFPTHGPSLACSGHDY